MAEALEHEQADNKSQLQMICELSPVLKAMRRFFPLLAAPARIDVFRTLVPVPFPCNFYFYRVCFAVSVHFYHSASVHLFFARL